MHVHHSFRYIQAEVIAVVYFSFTCVCWVCVHLISLSYSYVQNAVVKDSSISINRVTWSPDGDLIG
jgi:hypothetical protein